MIVFILLLEGYLSLSAEIITLRQLTPFAGNSVFITSLIIGFFLLALAFGYNQGGKYQDKHGLILIRNLSVVLLFFGIGLSYPLISAFFYISNQLFALNTLTSVTLYLMLVTVPLTFFIGQSIPLLVAMDNKTGKASSITGSALHVNTLGSFLGAVLTSGIFFNWFGVAQTINVGIILLSLIIVILISQHHERHYWLQTAILLGIAGVIATVNWQSESDFFVTTNAYSNYQLIHNDSEQSKVLVINNSPSSKLDNQLKPFPYMQHIQATLFEDLKLSDKKIAVLGAGGFTLTAKSDYGNEVVYVDIDPQIKRVVKDVFLPEVNGRFISQDARLFVQKHKETYDVIIADAMSNVTTIPFHLLTAEHFNNIKHALKPNGLAIINVIGSPFFKDNFTKRVDNSIHAIFPNCAVVPLNLQRAQTNILYYCRRDMSNDRTVYIDNLNTSPIDITMLEAKKSN